MADQKVAGLKPSDMVEGGGLLNDIEAEVKECRFTMWDYNGKIAVANPALRMLLVDDDGGEHEQYWSAGASKDWIASPDGKQLIGVGSAHGINTSSNVSILIVSAVNAGFPEDRLGDDISVFEGMRAFFTRVAAPKRTLTKTPRADGRQFDDTVLTIGKIVRLPWEKRPTASAAAAAKAKAGAASKASGRPTGTAKGAPVQEAGDGSVEGEAQEIVMGILAANPDGVPRQKLAQLAFQAAAGSGNRNAIVQMVFKEDFLGNGPWAYENGIAKLG